MRDSLRAGLLTLCLAAPQACTHTDRNAENPQSPLQGQAGLESGAPGPASTSTHEPVVPGVPNASSLERGPSADVTDSRTTIKPGGIAHPAGGTGGTLGTGGTGTGGFGTGGTGMAGISTGGSIVH